MGSAGETRGAVAAAAREEVSPAVLREGYRTGVGCLLHPAERDRDALAQGLERLEASLPGAAEPLREFLEGPDAWSEGTYLETLELAPACPPYLGAHLFDEPESCRGAARSDRNPYMVELRGIYRHFGWELDGGELPDYLPLMADFLRLTLDARDSRDRSIRRYFLEELVVPGLGPVRRGLEERESVYALPVRALEVVVDRDAERERDVPAWTPPEEERRPRPTCGQRLAGVQGVGAGGDGVGGSPGSGASDRATGGEA